MNLSLPGTILHRGRRRPREASALGTPKMPICDTLRQEPPKMGSQPVDRAIEELVWV